MMETVYYVVDLIIRIHIYLFYFLIISYLLEKVSGFYFIITNFNLKKSNDRAVGSAMVWRWFYNLFGISICLYDLNFTRNSPDVSGWILFGLFIIPYLMLARLFYNFYYHFQSRTQITKFRKKVNRQYREYKKRFKRWSTLWKSS